MQRKNITGKRFGRLVVQSLTSAVNGIVKWNCLCDCGSSKAVTYGNLNSGNTGSCGCLHRERLVSDNIIHGGKIGKKRTPEYNSWRGMIDRCYNSKNVSYIYYGAKGIQVCRRWLKFKNFLQDMGLKPDPILTIERIDNSKNYKLGNCKWATPKEQGQNRSNNVKFTINGETHTQSEWADKFGKPQRLIHQRVKILRWSIEKALKTELQLNG